MTEVLIAVAFLLLASLLGLYLDRHRQSTITTASLHGLQPGDVITVGGSIMRVRSVTATTVTVEPYV